MTSSTKLANLRPWPKGVSGNPGGRPRKPAIADALKEMLTLPLPGDRQGRTYAEVIAERLLREALRGSAQAAREIMDRTEGKPRLAPDTALSGQIQVTIRKVGED